MRRHLGRIGSGWALILVGTLIVAAVPVRLSAHGTLPEWGRPLTPGEGRALRREIGRLSRERGVHEATLVTIARALGADLRNIDFPELIHRLQAQANRAAELQAQNAGLLAQIAAVSDPAVRAPAEQTLARAIAAFDEGRLDDADREFAALEVLRRSESEIVHAAWLSAVDARAAVAELRLDYDAAEALSLSAAREEQSASMLSVERQWRFTMGAATARYNQGRITGENAALERAIVLYRSEALPLVPRAERPDDWAVTQHDLGNALMELGEREASSTRLEEAVAAYEAALEVRSRTRVPIAWAQTMNNLGNALLGLGERSRGTARLKRAAVVLRAALEEFPRDRYPLDWAQTQNHLAIALSSIGERERGTARLNQAVQIYQAALEELDRDRVPLGWAMAQNNLANVLMALGQRSDDVARLEQAVGAYEMVLQVWTRDSHPLEWATAQNNLGIALDALGRRETGTVRLEQAASAYEAALQEWTRERVPARWATTTTNLADAVALICERTRDHARLDEFERRVREAQAVLRAGGHRAGLGRANFVLRRIAAVRRRIGA